MQKLCWDDYFRNIARAVSLRADCSRRQVGAVLRDKDNHIAGTGYNGVRPGSKGCLEGACPRGRLAYHEVGEFTDYNDPDSPGYCISTHAEANALLHANQSVQGLTMYITAPPCPMCRKMLRNAGIARVVFPDGEYNWA